jgi:hypothetical protein
VRCRQPEKILLSPELAVLLAEPVELGTLFTGEEALVARTALAAVDAGCRTQRARLLEGRSSLWATALQERPSCRQSSTASAFCGAVNRRRVLVRLVIDGQSGGQGVTLVDLSSESGEPQSKERSAKESGAKGWV